MKRLYVMALALVALSVTAALSYEVGYMPTPMVVVDRMLELATLTDKYVVYDLGSGDGRIAIRAAKKFGVQAVGIERSPALVELAKAKAVEEGVATQVRFEVGDVLAANIRPATVVTLFLDVKFNAWLRPFLEEQLKPGTRIFSHLHPIPGWEPEVSQSHPLSSRAARLIHQEVYKVPPRVEGQKIPQGNTSYVWEIG